LSRHGRVQAETEKEYAAESQTWQQIKTLPAKPEKLNS